jgi:flagellar basal body rod protein FlgC
MDAFSIALNGVTAAEARFDADASAIAGTPTVDDASLARSEADAAEAKVDFIANVKVLRAADEMTGALLDIAA